MLINLPPIFSIIYVNISYLPFYILFCLDITYNTIKEAIENGAKTLDDIKDETEAGTICGMCEDEIQEILDELVK